jgi:hypothetical protein
MGNETVTVHLNSRVKSEPATCCKNQQVPGRLEQFLRESLAQAPEELAPVVNGKRRKRGAQLRAKAKLTAGSACRGLLLVYSCGGSVPYHRLSPSTVTSRSPCGSSWPKFSVGRKLVRRGVLRRLHCSYMGRFVQPARRRWRGKRDAFAGLHSQRSGTTPRPSRCCATTTTTCRPPTRPLHGQPARHQPARPSSHAHVRPSLLA